MLFIYHWLNSWFSSPIFQKNVNEFAIVTLTRYVAQQRCHPYYAIMPRLITVLQLHDIISKGAIIRWCGAIDEDELFFLSDTDQIR